MSAARLSGRAWFRKYMPPEVYPLVGIMGIMVSGATFMLYRISQSSDVVWDRKGDWKPWDKVHYDQNLKMYARDKSFWTHRHAVAAQETEKAVRARAEWDQRLKESLLA